ncbi:MAG: metal ABC transporter permease [Oscillospiraceae bacterium]|nr:metal ABC transporter permease [Oscillospiraceae bacterium]
MIELISELRGYFQHEMVQYAFIVAPLIALCAALVGVTLVLKRMSFIGQGLSNTAFCTIAVATSANVIISRINESSNFTLPETPTVLIVTVLCSILLMRMGQNTKINGDAAVAMISVGAMAMGYLLINKFPASSNVTADVCSTLFGSTSILTLTLTDVWTCAILSILVTAVFILFYNKIFAITFDEDFATATGVKAKMYNAIFAAIIAVIIVLSINLVGTLLISALVIFPALSAMRVFKTFLSVTLCSAVISVVCAVLGILVSMPKAVSTPVGSTIVAVNILCFGIFSLIGMFAKK